jgi:hypothetical protein
MKELRGKRGRKQQTAKGRLYVYASNISSLESWTLKSSV